MSASIQFSEWLGHIGREYIDGFIRDGGAAIKFAVPEDEGARPEMLEGLSEIGERAGYIVAQVGATSTRLHMIDDIFFNVAEHVPWRLLSRKVIAKFAAAKGYSWAEAEGAPLHRTLAEANGVDPAFLLLDLRKEIWTNVFKQTSLSRDFRMAMTHLAMAELSGGEEGETTANLVIEWLTGRNKAVSAVKSLQIFRRINRATARYCFESMLRWVRMAGYPGIVLLLDAARLTVSPNPKDGGIYYGKAAVLDAYEVLRQFIDSIDKLEGCFVAVLPEAAFLEDHARGMGAYEALKFRVFDEIRDRSLVNPMASLARIAASPLRGVAQ